MFNYIGCKLVDPNYQYNDDEVEDEKGNNNNNNNKNNIENNIENNNKSNKKENAIEERDYNRHRDSIKLDSKRIKKEKKKCC